MSENGIQRRALPSPPTRQMHSHRRSKWPSRNVTPHCATEESAEQKRRAIKQEIESAWVAAQEIHFGIHDRPTLQTPEDEAVRRLERLGNALVAAERHFYRTKSTTNGGKTSTRQLPAAR